MNNNTFIIGKPVELEYGTLRFLTFEECIYNQEILSLLTLNNLHIYYQYLKLYKDKSKQEQEQLKQLKDVSLIEFILSDEYFFYTYLNIIRLVTDFKDGYSEKYIFEDKNRFMDFRKLVMEMNLLKEEKVFYDERLQRGQEMSKKITKSKGENQTFEDVITTLVATTNKSFDEVLNMTVYQVYSIFARIGAIFNYQTTTLFATVSSEVTIESWSKHINLLDNNGSQDMKRTEFERKFGSAFNQ